MLLSFEYLLSISQKRRETLLETVQVPMQLLDLLRTPFRMILEHFAHPAVAGAGAACGAHTPIREKCASSAAHSSAGLRDTSDRQDRRAVR